jgi:hypothetical protein
MPEINPSMQRSLPRFCTQDFKSYCLLLEKMFSHNFSFKLNEMKFYTVLIYWSIREKLTYFYNKLRPVSRTLYIKCGVNSSLLIEFWFLQKVYGILDTCFITTHSIPKIVFNKFSLVCYSKKQGTLNRPISHPVHFYTTPYFCLREAYRQQRIWADDFTGRYLLWRLSSRETFFSPTLGLTTSLG